eukprot:scaffold322087_cov32-Tisochrysis_lutea.AAC.4
MGSSPPHWLHEGGGGRMLGRPLLAEPVRAPLPTLLLDWRALSALLVLGAFLLASQQLRVSLSPPAPPSPPSPPSSPDSPGSPGGRGASGGWTPALLFLPMLLSATAMLAVCLAACTTALDGPGNRAVARVFCAALNVAPAALLVTVRAWASQRALITAAALRGGEGGRRGGVRGAHLGRRGEVGLEWGRQSRKVLSERVPAAAYGASVLHGVPTCA